MFGIGNIEEVKIDLLEDKVEVLEDEVKVYEEAIDDYESEVSELEKDLSKALDDVDKYKNEVSATVSTSVPKNKKEDVKEDNEVETYSASDKGGETYEATYYGMDCNGCSGTTASGLNIGSGTTYKGMKVIAADTSRLPFHTEVEITDNKGKTYKAIVKDRGGNIKGNRIDILVGSEAESSKYGRHNVTIKVIKRGDNSYIRE